MSDNMLRVTVTEFCERRGVSRKLVVSMVELDIARPVAGKRAEDWVFDATGALWLEKALRLQRDLELEWDAVGIVVNLMRQREDLQRENAALRQRLARFLED